MKPITQKTARELLVNLQYVDSCTEGIPPPTGEDDETEIITIQMTIRGWKDIRAAITKAEKELQK